MEKLEYYYAHYNDDYSSCDVNDLRVRINSICGAINKLTKSYNKVNELVEWVNTYEERVNKAKETIDVEYQVNKTKEMIYFEYQVNKAKDEIKRLESIIAEYKLRREHYLTNISELKAENEKLKYVPIYQVLSKR